jgi:hypothetical protein
MRDGDVLLGSRVEGCSEGFRSPVLKQRVKQCGTL